MIVKENKGLMVIKQNGLCSIQNLSRISSQHLDFSASRAADKYAFLFANYLISTRDKQFIIPS